MLRPDSNDVGAFVGDYMRGSIRPTSRTGDLLYDIAKAYIADRRLAETWLSEVMQMVDSVL